MRDWVEYCNFDQPSTLALKRAANGSPQPFNVKYWGVGNEAWGCGGNFCPADYARQYKRYATYLRNFGDTPLYLIACGPDGNNTDWTRSFFKALGQPNPRWNARIHAFAAHYYAGTAGPSATEYSADQWYELLHKAAAVEQLILDQRAALDEFDPDRQIDLIIDEWGTWHAPTPGRNPNHLWQQNTLRDALVAAITLDTFNRHADKLAMANLAQAVNVLQSLFLTEDEKLVLTPTYHVFDLYQHHQGAKSLRVEIGTDLISFAAEGEKCQLPALSASASMNGDTLTLSVTNADTRRPVQALLEIPGRPLHNVEVEQTQLTAEDIHAHNTFDAPREVTPTDEFVRIGQDWRHDFPPASVSVFRVKL
jgi:alpha-N-arabinofuranosidase